MPSFWVYQVDGIPSRKEEGYRVLPLARASSPEPGQIIGESIDMQQAENEGLRSNMTYFSTPMANR